jgi:hypothetical protein
MEGAKWATNCWIDAEYANDLAIYAEDNAMRGIKQVVDGEVEVVLLWDSGAAGGHPLKREDLV